MSDTVLDRPIADAQNGRGTIYGTLATGRGIVVNPGYDRQLVIDVATITRTNGRG